MVTEATSAFRCDHHRDSPQPVISDCGVVLETEEARGDFTNRPAFEDIMFWQRAMVAVCDAATVLKKFPVGGETITDWFHA